MGEALPASWVQEPWFPRGALPTPSFVCVSPAGLARKMGSRGLGLTLTCCLLLAFAGGPVLGRAPWGQEGTEEPPLDRTER